MLTSDQLPGSETSKEFPGHLAHLWYGREDAVNLVVSWIPTLHSGHTFQHSVDPICIMDWSGPNWTSHVVMFSTLLTIGSNDWSCSRHVPSATLPCGHSSHRLQVIGITTNTLIHIRELARWLLNCTCWSVSRKINNAIPNCKPNSSSTLNISITFIRIPKNTQKCSFKFLSWEIYETLDNNMDHLRVNANKHSHIKIHGEWKNRHYVPLVAVSVGLNAG